MRWWRLSRRWFPSWFERRPHAGPRPSLETILIVGSPELRPPLEEMVGDGSYRIVFVEDIDGAHDRIAQAMPDRVVLCCGADDTSGLRLLSMLTIDARTRSIPAIAYVGTQAFTDEPSRLRTAACPARDS